MWSHFLSPTRYARIFLLCVHVVCNGSLRYPGGGGTGVFSVPSPCQVSALRYPVPAEALGLSALSAYVECDGTGVPRGDRGLLGTAAQVVMKGGSGGGLFVAGLRRELYPDITLHGEFQFGGPFLP